MKIKTLFLLAVLALAGAIPRPAHAADDVSFDFFYDALSPHGEWIEVGDYGSCWRPSDVDADWRPYSDGYWSYTDGGWTWVSYEEYGGIVYHYGRWVEVDDEGWCWVPDDEWAPAWVSWRSSDDYVGWAPLPPEARWRRDTGISVWVDSQYDIGPSRFNFCHVRDFGAPYLRPVIVNRYENVTIIQRTVNVTNISYYDDYDGGSFGGLVHCGGPSFAIINRHVHRPIPALKLVRNTNITNINIRQSNVFNSVARGNQLSVLAPRVAPRRPEAVRPVAVRSIPAAKVSNGWRGVKDQKVADDIRGKIRQETRGLTPESAPARRVQAAELKVLPAKADPNAVSSVRTARDRSPAAGKKPVAGAPGQPATEKSPATSAPTNLPVDPRTAERMLRENAREKTGDKPSATTVAPLPPRTLPKSQVTQTPEKKGDSKDKDSRGRQATRSIPTPAAPSSSGEMKKENPQTSGRTPAVRERGNGESDEKARAAAIAAQQRSATEQKERAATLDRLRATEDAAKKQKVQSEAPREMQRRQPAVAQPTREAAPAVKRSAPRDDSAQKAATQAASQQRQLESARRQQSENAQRQQASENARRSQMESARNAQAAQAAQAARSQQKMESVRREQPPQAARQQPAEAARRQPAAAPRQQPVQRQVAPVAPRGSQGSSSGREKPSKEDPEELKKSRGR